MKKPLNFSTHRQVITTLQIGDHRDIGSKGHYLQVRGYKNGKLYKHFIYRYTSPSNGKRRKFTLGVASQKPKDGGISLWEAREKLLMARKLVRDGIDPIDNKAAKKQSDTKAKRLTFEYVANEYIEVTKHSWKSKKHLSQWINTLSTYAYPVIGDLPVRDITLKHIEKILKPIWFTKHETANRLQARLQRVLDRSLVLGYRTDGINPAKYDGQFEHILKKIKKTPKHQATIPLQQAQDFYVALTAEETQARVATEMLLLTVTRARELCEMQWRQVNLSEALWVIPASRYKTGLEIHVPLTKRAMEIITNQKGKSQIFVFPSETDALKPISKETPRNVIQKRLKGYEKATAHGLRVMFAAWGMESEGVDFSIVDMCLGHAQAKIRNAYFRKDIVDKRRALLERWSEFLKGKKTL